MDERARGGGAGGSEVTMPRRSWFPIAMVFLVTGPSACVKYDTNVVTGPSHPASDAHPTVEKQTKAGDPVAKAKLVGSTIDVAVSAPTLCRDVTTTPAVADRTTEHHITKTGKYLQWAYAGGAVVLGGIGAYAVAGPCSQDVPSSQSQSGQQSAGQPTTRPCTPAEAQQQKNLGYGLLAGAGILAVPFVVNIVRGVDTTETVDGTRTDAQPWHQCGVAPARGVQVAVAFGGSQSHAPGLIPPGLLVPGSADPNVSAQPKRIPQLETTTDASGRAKIDLTKVVGTLNLARSPVAHVLVHGKDVATIDLSDSSVEQLWLTDAKLVEQCQRYCDDQRAGCDRSNTAGLQAGTLECDVNHRKCAKSCTSSRKSRRHTMNAMADPLVTHMLASEPWFVHLALPIDSEQKSSVAGEFLYDYAHVRAAYPDLDFSNKASIEQISRNIAPYARAIASSEQAYQQAKIQAILDKAQRKRAEEDAREMLFWAGLAAAAQGSSVAPAASPPASTAGSGDDATKKELDQLKAEQKRQREAQEQREQDERDQKRRRVQERYGKELECQRNCDNCNPSEPDAGCVARNNACRKACHERYTDDE